MKTMMTQFKKDFSVHVPQALRVYGCKVYSEKKRPLGMLVDFATNNIIQIDPAQPKLKHKYWIQGIANENVAQGKSAVEFNAVLERHLVNPIVKLTNGRKTIDCNVYDRKWESECGTNSCAKKRCPDSCSDSNHPGHDHCESGHNWETRWKNSRGIGVGIERRDKDGAHRVTTNSKQPGLKLGDKIIAIAGRPLLDKSPIEKEKILKTQCTLNFGVVQLQIKRRRCPASGFCPCYKFPVFNEWKVDDNRTINLYMAECLSRLHIEHKELKTDLKNRLTDAAETQQFIVALKLEMDGKMSFLDGKISKLEREMTEVMRKIGTRRRRRLIDRLNEGNDGDRRVKRRARA